MSRFPSCVLLISLTSACVDDPLELAEDEAELSTVDPIATTPDGPDLVPVVWSGCPVNGGGGRFAVRNRGNRRANSTLAFVRITWRRALSSATTTTTQLYSIPALEPDTTTGNDVNGTALAFHNTGSGLYYPIAWTIGVDSTAVVEELDETNNQIASSTACR